MSQKVMKCSKTLAVIVFKIHSEIAGCYDAYLHEDKTLRHHMALLIE